MWVFPNLKLSFKQHLKFSHAAVFSRILPKLLKSTIILSLKVSDILDLLAEVGVYDGPNSCFSF